MSRLRILLVSVFVALIATSSFGYTLYLKDGTTITIKGPYEERDGRAYFTYPNGNQSFLKMELLDVAKTDERNQSDIGGAAVIQDAEIIEKTVEPAPKKRTLSDMIRERKQRSATPSPPQEEPSDAPEATEEDRVEAPMTAAGFPDLTEMEHLQYRDLELAAGIVGTFRSQSIDGVRIYQGTRVSHPLVTVNANSEGAVLRAVAVAASALAQIRELGGDQVEALELVITTPTGQRAGQFVMTPDLADALLSGQIEPTAFYVEYVQF